MNNELYVYLVCLTSIRELILLQSYLSHHADGNLDRAFHDFGHILCTNSFLLEEEGGWGTVEQAHCSGWGVVESNADF